MQFEDAGKFIIDKLSKELPDHLSYHSIGHVLDVFEATKQIAEKENVSPNNLKLLLTAAWYHDSGFIKGAKNHEEESCRIAAEALPDFGYRPEEIEQICGMIMATKLPQSPKNQLEKILADADLDYLGRNDFFTTGNKLFLELSKSEVVNSEQEWNELQVRFMESHHYFTPTALQLRQAKKAEHLEQVKAKLTNIE